MARLRDVVTVGPNRQQPNWKEDLVAAFAEFIGMAIFIFLALGGVQAALEAQYGPSATTSQIQSVALSFGGSVMVGLFMCCPYSEGALNTAVLFSLVLCRKVNWLRGILFFFAELGGSIIGAYFANFVTGNELQGVNLLKPGFNYAQGFFAEVLLTMIFCLVILFVIVDNQFSSPAFNPLVVGITLFMVHMVGTPIDGTSVNPARSFGPAIVTGKWANHWIFWFGPLIGSFFAYLIYCSVKIAKNNITVIDYEKDAFMADHNGKLAAPIPQQQQQQESTNQPNRVDVINPV
ncbi:aquaporin-like protein [Halteromyces radiatus]|uniref:aquaporin-like protein n=1 Tax=Halteromyces radiatus TaxID=101107 RepID=UPI00222041F4|nr:aquaporin-like protein [Halteromyces radiatus]KAI8086754.1 aquaporin-like protein [Halteromyces radiatus]